LIGCGPYGDSFASLPGVTIVEQYRWEDLPAILGKLDPDIALLPSVVPETFSYTLQELNELGIPTLATNIGSFADRIHDGINGFLCPPTAEGIISRLRQIADDRSVLRPIHQRLSNASSRSVCQMIADYDALLPVPQVSSRAYFSADSRRTTTAPQCGRAQLYWRAVNETYTEERSTSASFELKTQKQVLGLHIPERETEIVELRIDFAERPGLLLLHSINLLDPNGKSVWRCDRDRSGIETLMRSGIAVLREQEMDQGALLLLSGGDPHFILPIPSGGKSLLRGGCLTYEFSWRTIEEWRNTLLASDNSTKLSADECDLLLAEPSSSRPERFDGPAGNPEHATLKNDLLASRARVVDLENSLSWRITSPLRALGALGMKRQNSAASPTDNAERPDQRSKKQLGLG
jgi:hypothetical protein